MMWRTELRNWRWLASLCVGLACASCAVYDDRRPNPPSDVPPGDAGRDAAPPQAEAPDGLQDRDAATSPPSAAEASTDAAGASANVVDAGGPRDAADASVEGEVPDPPKWLDSGIVQATVGCPTSSDPAYEVKETRCDGVDNDCDGLIDVLLPLEHNRCSTACGAGY